MALGKMRGFSLLEMITAIVLMLIMAAITFMALQPALKENQVNAAYNVTLSTMRQARQWAVDTREDYIVTFVAPQTIQVSMQSGGTLAPPPVLVSTYQLPNNIQFRIEPGTPTPTPDGWRSGAFPIDFDQGVGGGGVNSIYFYPDGSAHDNVGRANNGTVNLARPNELYSSRVITLFGLSGRMRGWRLLKGSTSGSSQWVAQ